MKWDCIESNRERIKGKGKENMKKIKRTITKVLVGAMVLSLCSGCNNSKKKEEKESSKTIAESESLQKEIEENRKVKYSYEDNSELKFLKDNKGEYINNIDVKKYFVYGTHFDFESSISLKKLGCSDVESASLCAINVGNGDNDISSRIENAIKIDYENDGEKVEFKASEYINNGLYLENIREGIYELVLCIKTDEGKTVYAPLVDKTKEKDITYYTVTNLKDKSNKKINIYSPKEVSNEYNEKYMFFSCAKTELPEDVYDIVIDPGHGGSDVGAVSGEYYEKDLSLEIAKMVYEKLKNKGYKVLITRDGSEDNEDYSVYTSYEKNGRVTLACGSKAKYALSIHLNSSEADMSTGGVQIYCSSRGNTNMARKICDNLIKEADTYPSSLQGAYYREDGIYSHSFTDSELAELKGIAYQYGFKPYKVKNGDDYLYMIRELGGISTNAYTDGRHPQYGTNKWVNANYGVECCLCELAYMSVESDLEHFLENKEKYAEGLCKGLMEEIKTDK